MAPFIINFLNGSVWGRFCTFHANKRKSAIFWTWSAQKIFLTGLFFPFYFLPKRWIIFAGPFNKVPKDCNLGEGCGSHHFVAWRSPLLKKYWLPKVIFKFCWFYLKTELTIVQNIQKLYLKKVFRQRCKHQQIVNITDAKVERDNKSSLRR